MTEVAISRPAATAGCLPMQPEKPFGCSGFPISRMGKGAVSTINFCRYCHQMESSERDMMTCPGNGYRQVTLALPVRVWARSWWQIRAVLSAKS